MEGKESEISEKRTVSGSSLVYWFTRKNDRKILHIAGKGDMPNFGVWESGPPWFDFHEVVVENGVASLGEYAFSNRSKLEKIDLPPSLRHIGKHCFENCVQLESIEWPSSVREVKSSSFKGCGSLKSVFLPEGVAVIWRWAFQDCKSLQHIKIPSSIERVSTTAFFGVDLNRLDLSACRYDVEDDCLYDGDCLIASSNQNKSVQIRSGTRVISDYSFYRNKTVEEVYCPKTVKDVQKKAFAHCVNLKRVYCENEDVRIGDAAFEDCPVSLSYAPNVAYQLTMETGRIAATRQGYALLRDGRVSFSKECVNGDLSPLLRYDDFVDIQAGFDFIIGLRKNGEVVSTKKPPRKIKKYCLSLEDIGDVAFPNNVRFPAGMKQIAAAESRVGGIDKDGCLFLCQASSFEQPDIATPSERAKSVSVGFYTALYVDEDDRLKLLTDNNAWKQGVELRLNRRIKCIGEIPAQCIIHNPYYSAPTVAVLTNRRRLIWSADILDKSLEFPIPAARFTIGSGVAAAIDDTGRVFVQFKEGNLVEVPSDKKAVDVGIIHRDDLIVLYENGKDSVFNLKKLSEERIP